MQQTKNICKENVTLYYKEAIVLNNCFQRTKSDTHCPPGFVDGDDGGGNVIGEEQIVTYNPLVWSV